jgi:hypothetical protein
MDQIEEVSASCDAPPAGDAGRQTGNRLAVGQARKPRSEKAVKNKVDYITE